MWRLDILDPAVESHGSQDYIVSKTLKHYSLKDHPLLGAVGGGRECIKKRDSHAGTSKDGRHVQDGCSAYDSGASGEKMHVAIGTCAGG